MGHQYPAQRKTPTKSTPLKCPQNTQQFNYARPITHPHLQLELEKNKKAELTWCPKRDTRKRDSDTESMDVVPPLPAALAVKESCACRRVMEKEGGAVKGCTDTTSPTDTRTTCAVEGGV